MTPPEAPVAGEYAQATASFSAVSVCPVVLRKRADFLLAAKADWLSKPGMAVQARRRHDDEIADIRRVGYTCSKKVGNAVARNRAKRRLREVARIVIPQTGRAGWDYVLIGRRNATAERSFEALCEDLTIALKTLHRKTS